MMQRRNRGTMGSFSRGADLWMHQARLFVMAVLTVVGISGAMGLCAGAGYYYMATTPVERYALNRNVLGRLRLAVDMDKAQMELYLNGRPQMLDVRDVVSMTQDIADGTRRKFGNAAVIGGLTMIGAFVIVGMYLWSYGQRKIKDVQLRGSSLVDGPDLKEALERRGDASPYVIAGVPMRSKSENLHTLIAGAQGTGKSQQIVALLKQVRARGKRAIVYDPSGEFTQAFYRPGIDVLMNPLDSRSPNWNIWEEIQQDYHFDTLSNGLIPDPAEADPFWAKAGRMVLKDVYKVLGAEGLRTNKALYNAIAKSNLESLHALLAGEAGATYVDPTTERTGMSLKMTVQNQLEAFRFLRDDGEPFSIRRWVQGEGESWMFITAREELRQALAPVLSLWIDTAMNAVLSLEPTHQERLWLFIDELPTLQKLDILKLVLTNTRKYGLCTVLGVQDFSQVYEIYGHDLAKTIISGCQTKLLLRVTDGAAAKLMSELMGQAEINEMQETLSYGLNSSRDGVSMHDKRDLREIVLTSEILTLPDMKGYLVIPGDYPIAKVKYEYVPTPKVAEGFIQRTGFGVSYSAPVTAAGSASPVGTSASQGGGDESSPVFDMDTGELLGPRSEVRPAVIVKPQLVVPAPRHSLADGL